MAIFRSCIDAVNTVTPNGFAALKITALGDPVLLERMSACITEAARLFDKFDKDGDGKITREEFKLGYEEFFTESKHGFMDNLIERLDPMNSGRIDVIEWSNLLQPADVPKLVSRCKDQGPLFNAAPTEEDLLALENTKRRLNEVAKFAFDNKVRLLIDAEQTWFQPAIDNFTLELMKKYNDREKTPVPIIFNTYQCYLKDSTIRLKKDTVRAKRDTFHFACKLVRGAYMGAENARAQEGGHDSPIHDSIQDTHDCYNSNVRYLFEHRLRHDTRSEVMLGTHNQESIEKALDFVENRAKGKDVGFHCAQLLGMRDNLTFALGKRGYNAYKYVPYGKVDEVLPYLSRRAQENSDVAAGMGKEKDMIAKEIRSRLFRM